MAGSDPWEAAVGTSLSVVSHQNILYIISIELGRQSVGSMLCRCLRNFLGKIAGRDAALTASDLTVYLGLP